MRSKIDKCPRCKSRGIIYEVPREINIWLCGPCLVNYRDLLEKEAREAREAEKQST